MLVGQLEFRRRVAGLRHARCERDPTPQQESSDSREQEYQPFHQEKCLYGPPMSAEREGNATIADTLIPPPTSLIPHPS